MSVYIVVAVSGSGDHSVVEVYSSFDNASFRVEELVASGFAGERVSLASRAVLSALDPARPWGPAWKEGVGWTQQGA